MKEFWLRAIEFNRHVWQDAPHPKSNPIGFVLTIVLVVGFLTSPFWHEYLPDYSGTPMYCPCEAK